MKRAVLALVLVAGGCTPTVILGTLALDGGGGGDLGDMPLCTTCDMAQSLTDIASSDLGDGFLTLDSGPGGDL